MSPPWRQASTEEIRAYYRAEFPRYLDELPPRIHPQAPREFGLGFRERYPTVGDDVPPRNFIRRSTWETNEAGKPTHPRWPDWEPWVDWLQAPAGTDPLPSGNHKRLADPMLVEADGPVPERVYYSLQSHLRPWVLLVDIDAKDVAAGRVDSSATAVTATDVTQAPPAGYDYSFEDLSRTIDYGFRVKDFFEEQLAADSVEVLYSGQGVHVSLLDTDAYHRYDKQSRNVIVDVLEKNHGIPLDGQVTVQPKRFGRVPYSLHAGVCRVVQPITSPEFDPRTAALPEFLMDSSAGDSTSDRSELEVDGAHG